MRRLTNSNKSIIEGTATPIDVHKEQLIYLKLKSLEDIEEELGIGLRILFKALKNGFYHYDNGIVHTSNNESYISLQAQSCLPNQMCIEVDYGDRTMCFYFEDYRKTWALTREDLENDEKII